MSIEAAIALRTKIASNTALTSWFITNYGKNALHTIGYKHTKNANDFPSVSYVVPTSEIGDAYGERMIVVIVVGVNNPGITNGVYDGVKNVEEAARLILAILALGAVDSHTMWTGTATITNDMGLRHPFYETEIQIPLIWR